ncbi:MAG: 50S ribosomal protein L4 [Lentisphaeria bacterium]|nr:50S ribosomal protein L4 [Lentisphaeria bacterium]
MNNVLNILDCKGAKVAEYVFPENYFELERGSQAVHDSVVAFLAGNRAGTACTKNRGEVSGGGAKPFRQKGTGRARAGSSRNPVWTGGGVAFGPKPRSFAKKVNKKVTQLALRRAISERINEGSVIIIDKFDLPDHKTKSAVAIFKALNISGNAMLVVPELEESVASATGNLAEVVVRLSAGVNVYEILRFNTLVMTKDAMDAFVERLG